MSAPLSSGKDRNATAPLASNPDSNHARALDILDELQRALDETRLAGAAHQSPPLQPSGEENSPVEKDGAPPFRSPYAPKSSERANTSAGRGAVLRTKPSLIVTPGLANATNPDFLGPSPRGRLPSRPRSDAGPRSGLNPRNSWRPNSCGRLGRNPITHFNRPRAPPIRSRRARRTDRT